MEYLRVWAGTWLIQLIPQRSDQGMENGARNSTDNTKPEEIQGEEQLQWLNQISIQSFLQIILSRRQGKTEGQASTSHVPTALLPGPSNSQLRDLPSWWWPSGDLSFMALSPSPIYSPS